MKDFLMRGYCSVAKARKTFTGLALTGCLILMMGISSCGGDQLDIPNQPLQGLIDGNTWSSASANAYRLGGFQFRVRFLSELEPVSDPCTLPSPGLAHVKAIFTPSIGDFTVSPFAIDDNQVQVAFEISPAKSLNATSGSMAIIDINGGIMVGYLQAELDDGNSVEGSFRVSICD